MRLYQQQLQVKSKWKTQYFYSSLINSSPKQPPPPPKQLDYTSETSIWLKSSSGLTNKIRFVKSSCQIIYNEAYFMWTEKRYEGPTGAHITCTHTIFSYQQEETLLFFNLFMWLLKWTLPLTKAPGLPKWARILQKQADGRTGWTRTAVKT